MRLKFLKIWALRDLFFVGQFRDIPAKSRDIPPKSLVFPGFRRTYRTFWHPPLEVEDPHPTRKYPDQKVWVWVPFSSLTIRHFFGEGGWGIFFLSLFLTIIQPLLNRQSRTTVWKPWFTDHWYIESVLTTSMSKQRGFTKFSVFLKRVSLLKPRVRMNFVAFSFRKKPGKSLEVRSILGCDWGLVNNC